MIMQIEVGTSSPHMPSSIHERTHHRSSSKKALHIERAHDEAKCPSPGDSHCCTSVRFPTEVAPHWIGGFQQECGQHFSPIADWMRVLTYFLRMRGNNMGTWKRRPQLPEHPLLVWGCGLVTTGKRLVVLERAKSRKHFGRNSPSAPLL